MNTQITIWEIIENKNNREKLILDNQRLVYATVNKMQNKGWFANYKKTFSTEDLYQIGMIGLIKAADKYDPNRNVKFSSYATTSIKNNILNELRDNSIASKNGNESHDSKTIAIDESYTDTNTIENSEEIRQHEVSLVFKRMINHNPKEESFINEMQVYIKEYGEGYTYAEIAKKYNIPIKDLRNKLNKLRRLAKAN